MAALGWQWQLCGGGSEVAVGTPAAPLCPQLPRGAPQPEKPAPPSPGMRLPCPRCPAPPPDQPNRRRGGAALSSWTVVPVLSSRSNVAGGGYVQPGRSGRPVRTVRRGRPGRGPPLRAVPPRPRPGVSPGLRGLRRGWNGEGGRSWLGLAAGKEGSLDGQDNGGGVGAGQADGQTDGHAGVGYEDHPSCFPRSSISGCPTPLVQSGGRVGCSSRGVPGSVPSPQLATALGLLLLHAADNRGCCARQNRRCRESRSKSLAWCLVAPAVAETSERAV